MNTYIHQTATIDPGAQIGDGTKIWHYSHVMPSAILGQNCILGQNVFIGNKVMLGNNVKVQNNVSIYEGVVCEDDVFLGPSMVFTNVLNPRSFLERKDEFRPTLIKKGATIGANATIVCGIEIGEYALIGAGTVVTKNIPPYALVIGNPGRQTGWVSRNGHKLSFNETGHANCPETKERYKLENNQIIPLEN